MSLVELNFAELHGPLFLGGKNHGLKLDPGRHADLKIAYDREEKELLVTWKGYTAIIPTSNVVSMTAGTVVPKGAQHHHPMTLAAGQTAQVETPMSHVHAGQGHGRTGKR